MFLLILGVWVRAAESGFVNYYRGDFENALTDLRQKGDEGNAYAAYLVGQIYAGGRPDPPIEDLALEWYVKAASQGSIAAPFSYLDHQLVSTSPSSWFLCGLSRGGATEREGQKHLCVFIFVPIPFRRCL